MRLVHRHGGETAVEQVTPPPPASIDEIRPATVRGAQGARHALSSMWHEDQVDVVRLGPDLHLGLAHRLGQHVEVDILIAVLEEDRLATVAARGHVMRAAGSNNAGEAGHEGRLDRKEHNGNIKAARGQLEGQAWGTLLLSPYSAGRAALRRARQRSVLRKRRTLACWAVG